MIGYLCAYLRYYHTPYFITSYLNNAQNEDDIVGGFEMAKLYGYNILPPRFRHSTDRYMYDKGTKDIYKGVSSIKFLNAGSSEYLYSLRDNKYDSFIDLLAQIEEDKQINSRQMEILIKLQYFEEFGKNKKLLALYNLFKALYGRKNLSKDKLVELELNEALIASNCEKETDKQYVNIDPIKILKNAEKCILDENIPIQEQIKFELDVVGYISAIYNVDKKYCIVLDIDTKYSPKISLYSLGSGKDVQCKINKINFKESPIKRGQIIECIKFIKKPKMKKTDKGWEQTTEMEWWLSDWKVSDIDEIV